MPTVPLSALWLPILLSAVFVFIASNVLHMVIGAWHRGDYKKVPNEPVFLDAFRDVPSGQYVIPLHDWKSMTPEQRAAAMAGPSAMVMLRNPQNFSFGKTLGLWLLYCLVISLFVGYLASVTVARGADYLTVFRVAGTAGVMGWALGGTASDSIWFGRPWPVTFKHIVDGIIYGLLVGGTFGWLWP